MFNYFVWSVTFDCENTKFLSSQANHINNKVLNSSGKTNKKVIKEQSKQPAARKTFSPTNNAYRCVIFKLIQHLIVDYLLCHVWNLGKLSRHYLYPYPSTGEQIFLFFVEQKDYLFVEVFAIVIRLLKRFPF